MKTSAATNNILLSPCAISNQSEGGAYVHNLMIGSVYTRSEPNRFTPYFLPHSTMIAGLATIKSGDDRYYNNIFVGLGDNAAIYNKYNKFKHDFEGYNNAKLQLWMDGNIYYNEAKPFTKDTNSINSTAYNPEIKLVEDGEDVFLYLTFDQAYYNHEVKTITTELLGKAIIPKAVFDNPDGTSLKIDTDYFGDKRLEENNSAGPFLNLNTPSRAGVLLFILTPTKS